MALHDPLADIVFFTVSCFLRSVTFVLCKAIDIPKKALSTLYLFQPQNVNNTRQNTALNLCVSSHLTDFC